MIIVNKANLLTLFPDSDVIGSILDKSSLELAFGRISWSSSAEGICVVIIDL